MVNDSPTIDLFAAEVCPRRELVAAERAGQGSRAVARNGQETLEHGTGPWNRTRHGRAAQAERLWDESPVSRGPRPSRRALHRGGPSLASDLVAGALPPALASFALERLIARVAAGRLDPGSARRRSRISRWRQNQWTVCAYCESYFRLVDAPHDRTSRAVSPDSRSSTTECAFVDPFARGSTYVGVVIRRGTWRSTRRWWHWSPRRSRHARRCDRGGAAADRHASVPLSTRKANWWSRWGGGAGTLRLAPLVRRPAHFARTRKIGPPISVRTRPVRWFT